MQYKRRFPISYLMRAVETDKGIGGVIRFTTGRNASKVFGISICYECIVIRGSGKENRCEDTDYQDSDDIYFGLLSGYKSQVIFPVAILFFCYYLVKSISKPKNIIFAGFFNGLAFLARDQGILNFR